MKALLSFFLFAASGALPASDLATILAPLTTAPNKEVEATASAPVCTRISEADLTVALRAALKAHLSLEGDLRISLTQPWTSPSLPSNIAWEVSVLQTPSTGLSSTSLIRFRVDCAGSKVGEWQTVVRAQLFRQVWAAAKQVDQHQPLSLFLCQKVNVDVLREKQAPVPAEIDLATYQANHSLTPDQILTWRDISTVQAIRKGQAVEVIASEGAMNITMKGTAITSGSVGEDIIVRNLDSRRDVSARVMDSSKARVNF